MIQFSDIIRYYKLGVDSTGPFSGGRPPQTQRCYVPSLGYARAVSPFFSETDDNLLTNVYTGYHLTPEGIPNEQGFPIRYPRYVYTWILTTDDSQADAIQLGTEPAYNSGLAQIAARQLAYRNAFATQFENDLSSLPANYEAGDGYIANVFLPTYNSPYVGFSAQETLWYSVAIFPGAPTSPSPLTPVLPTGYSLLSNNTYNATTTGTYFPGGIPTTYTIFRRTLVTTAQNDPYIAARAAALLLHGSKFRVLKACDYYVDQPVTFNVPQSNTTDGSFPSTPAVVLASQSGIFSAANSFPHTNSTAVADAADACVRIASDAVTFFAT